MSEIKQNLNLCVNENLPQVYIEQQMKINVINYPVKVSSWNYLKFGLKNDTENPLKYILLVNCPTHS